MIRRRINWPIAIILGATLLFAAYVGLCPHPWSLFANLNERRMLGIAGDHYLHFAVFFILATFGGHVLIPPISLRIILVIGFFGAFGSEALQGLFPWKTFDWFDIIANLIGLFAGLGLSHLLQRRRTKSSREEHIPLESIIVAQ